MKSEYIQVRISEAEKNELAEIASHLDRPISQIIREALREKLADLKEGNSRPAEAQEVETAAV